MADHGNNGKIILHVSPLFVDSFDWIVPPNFNHSDINGQSGVGTLISPVSPSLTDSFAWTVPPNFDYSDANGESGEGTYSITRVSKLSGLIRVDIATATASTLNVTLTIEQNDANVVAAVATALTSNTEVTLSYTLDSTAIIWVESKWSVGRIK